MWCARLLAEETELTVYCQSFEHFSQSSLEHYLTLFYQWVHCSYSSLFSCYPLCHASLTGKFWELASPTQNFIHYGISNVKTPRGADNQSKPLPVRNTIAQCFDSSFSLIIYWNDQVFIDQPRLRFPQGTYLLPFACSLTLSTFS